MPKPEAPAHAKRIKSLAKRLAELNARGGRRRFLAPMNEAAFAGRLGARLPDEMRAFYLEVAGGERMSPVIVAFLASLLAQTACSPKQPCDDVHVAAEARLASPAELQAAKANVAAMIDDWHDAAAKADEERYFAHLHDESVFLGTDETERWSKNAFRDYARPHFAKGAAWSFRSKRRDIVVHPRGDLAHFDEDLETRGLGPARGSGVAVRDGDKWLLLKYNLAITVPNDRFDLVKEAAGAARVLASEAPADMEPIASLSGSWVGAMKPGESVEEHWTHVDAGTLVGTARNVRDGKMIFFELLRIERRPDGEVVYVAQPRGNPPVEFKRTSPPSKTEIVFENAKNEWPKKLTYRFREGRLDVRIEGDPKQLVKEWTMEPAVVRRAKLPSD